MKWNRAERRTDPQPAAQPKLLAVFFFLGIGAGVVCAGRISGDVERELTTYLTDYLALAQSQDLGISVVCSLTLLYLQGPVLAFLCGVCSAGILLLPLLAAAARLFSGLCGGVPDGFPSAAGQGLPLALAFFGFRCLVTVALFFLLAGALRWAGPPHCVDCPGGDGAPRFPPAAMVVGWASVLCV
ncbi:MAG: hypothetical protein ACLSHO_07560 [Dysosmobacter sp.]